ncbi:MAG: VOC family protein [Pseudomonadota bacterium]
MRNHLTTGGLGKDLSAVVNAFVEPIFKELVELDLLKEISEVDHVCYRVPDVASYEEFKRAFSPLGLLLSEAFINGRPIACYKLHTPIKTSIGLEIGVVELPAPREGVAYPEGFEHIEIVTGADLQVLLKRYPTLSFNLQNYSAASNREVSLKLKSGVVKFHERSLEEVILEEKAAIKKRPEKWIAVLDFDDTLLDSRQPFLMAIHKALEKYLGKSIPFKAIEEKARPTFPEFFANFGILGAEAFESVIEFFKLEWPFVMNACSVPLGIPSLLSCLVSEGVDIHVWTARDEDTVKTSLKTFGISQFVKSIHAFDGRSVGKPTPSDRLRSICSEGRTILVGDSQADCLGASSLGAKFLQALWAHEGAIGAPNEALCSSPLVALSKMMAVYQSNQDKS